MTDFYIEDDSSLLVWDKDSFIKRLMGNLELAEKLLTKYKENINDELELLIKAVNEDDSYTALHVAHKMNGSSNSVGAVRVGYIATIIEDLAKKDDLNSIFDLLQKLQVEVANFKSVAEL
jgi:HPt (histidine-containing phosphotransfer) domain-containing protein